MAAVPPPPSKAPPPGVATPGAKRLPPSVPGSKTPSPLAGSQSFAPPPASKQPPSGVKSLQSSQSATIPPSTSAPLPPASYNSNNNNNLNQTPKSSATTGASAPSPAPAPAPVQQQQQQQQQQQASGTYNNNNATTSSSSNNAPPQRPPPSQQQQQASASASASRSGSASAGAGANNNLSTIKVRNIQSSLMYHLMFEGDISALNGSQLRQHVEGVSGIPSDKQILSYRGRTIGSMTTGADLGLTNGATLNLEVAGNTNDTSMMSTSSHQQRQPSPARSQAPQPQPRGSAVSNNTNASRSGSTAGMNYSSKQQQQYVGGPEAMTISHRDDYQSSLYQRHEPYQRSTQRGNYSSSYPQHHQMVGMSSNNTSRNNFVDDYDDDVVVDVIEESDAPALNPEVGPGFVGGDAVAVSQFRRTAADVEEQRLQQQEYIWKLEQVRFETERLNREREMKRQLMELEYEASLLDRDRVELERHTAMEKQKLHHVMSQNRIEMDILQKFFPGQQQM